jgi:hypothetical protein
MLGALLAQVYERGATLKPLSKNDAEIIACLSEEMKKMHRPFDSALQRLCS